MAAAPSALLFDLDGTLLDTGPDLANALNTVLIEAGRAPLPYAQVRPFVSHGSIGLLELGFGLTPAMSEFSARRERLLEVYRNALACETRLFEGMDEVLDTLESRGLPWGIVTNKPGWLTTPLLDALALAARAACVISGDTTAHSKPHPAPLLTAARDIGQSPATCLYVGDAARDVAAARAAGMPVLVARYGYLAPDDRPERWGADACIDSPRALLDWL